MLSAQNEDKTLHYLPDDLGSPIRLMNEHGMRREVLGYDEFGASLYPSFRSQPFTFTGYQLDTIADMYFSPSRAYSPSLGRFISEDIHWNSNNRIYGDSRNLDGIPNPLLNLAPDPFAIGQSANLYGYTMNNPINHVDPTGKIILTSIIVGAAVAAGFNAVQQTASNMDFREIGSSFNNGSIRDGFSTLGSEIVLGAQQINVTEVIINGVVGGANGELVENNDENFGDIVDRAVITKGRGKNKILFINDADFIKKYNFIYHSLKNEPWEKISNYRINEESLLSYKLNFRS